jgi:hypothetical protein
VVETNHHAAFLFRPKIATFSYTKHLKALRPSMPAFNVKNVALSLNAVIEKVGEQNIDKCQKHLS